MKRDELRRRLERLEVSGEQEAHERSWRVVAAAFAERESVPRRRPRARPLLVLAAALALVAAAATPPGRAVIDTVRERVLGVEEAQPALFRLPASGRLLVDSPAGTWIVHADGSKRLLAGYRQASWSPHGFFVVAVRGRELAALEPGGRVRWSLARPDVRHPRWGGTRVDTRIVYVSGRTLRVVAGDGTGDRLLARSVAPVAPAWRPGARHALAYVAADGAVVLTEESGRTLWRRQIGDATALEWSPDGELLLVRGRRTLRVLGPGGGVRFDLLAAPAAPVAAARFGPDSRSVAFVQQAAGRSDLWVVPELRPDASAARRVFSGAGAFTGLAWSPDGRWLLLAWEDADQWVFVRSASVRGLEAVSDVSRQFGGSFPALGGWCCPPAGEAAPAASVPTRMPAPAAAAPAAMPEIEWRGSTALGLPHAGRLVDGVELPREGPTFFTWDPVRKVSPNPRWRRYGTDTVIRTLLGILEDYAATNPGAPRVGVGDLSRPSGGPFGPKHVSHQNGLDVDVYFPRLDRGERPPDRPEEIDLVLAQDLVDRFVAAGAERVFVGPRTGLTGPPGVVQVLANHDNHLHARFPNGSELLRVEAGGRKAAQGALLLGRSHEGRPIRALRVGAPRSGRKILVVGCIHGNECAGMKVTRMLARLPRPAAADLWLVPNLNPDGLARGVRQNGRGVDLNRNFDAEWRRAGRRWDPEYPGPAPFSEREARIARNLILRLRPELTIWYHQPQDVVRAWGPSIPAARRFAALSTERFRAIRWPVGTAPNWQNRAFPGSAAFVVELPAGELTDARAGRHARAILALAEGQIPGARSK